VAPDGGTGARVLVLNPASGDASHGEQVRRLAADHGFEIRETEGEGNAVELAAAAAREGADLVAAAGGDGTLNEVVRGLFAADALPDVAFAAVPAGTGNNFAGNVGIEGIEHAFEVIERGDFRRIDLGIADGEPFLNSCVGGLTARASAETTSDLKENLGVVAYVLETFKTAVEYEGVRMDIETRGGGDSWHGDAVLLLVGNGRRFPIRGRTQANMEDGLLDVTVVEENPGSELAELARSAAMERLFGTDAAHVTRLRAPALTVAVRDDEATFSLDGEMVSASALDVRTEPEVVELPVGDAYEPDPDR